MVSAIVLRVSLLIISILQPVISLDEFSWSQWEQWPRTCSATCAKGQRCRRRHCLDGLGIKIKDQSKCTGEYYGCQTCMSYFNCPINAGWGQWLHWTKCKPVNQKVKCGEEVGIHYRRRLCNNPKPKHEGKECFGNRTESSVCDIECAPKDYFLFKARSQVSQYIRNVKNNIIIKKRGERIILNCDSPVYRTIIYGDMTKMKVITWKRNGRPLFGRYDESLRLALFKSEQTATTTGRYKLFRTYLQIDNLHVGDSGVYTCTMEYDGIHRLLISFYTLVVGTRKIAVSAGDTLYFYSNAHSFAEHVEFDNSTIHWYLDGQSFESANKELEGLNGLAMRKTFWKRPVHVWLSHSGYWECYINHHVSGRRWLTNGFQLEIMRPISIWTKLKADKSLALMSLTTAMLSVFTWLAFFGTILAIRREEKLKITESSQEDIIHEEVENYIRLFLVTKRRAFIRSEKIEENIVQVEEDYDVIRNLELDLEEIMKQRIREDEEIKNQVEERLKKRTDEKKVEKKKERRKDTKSEKKKQEKKRKK